MFGVVYFVTVAGFRISRRQFHAHSMWQIRVMKAVDPVFKCWTKYVTIRMLYKYNQPGYRRLDGATFPKLLAFQDVPTTRGLNCLCVGLRLECLNLNIV